MEVAQGIIMGCIVGGLASLIIILGLPLLQAKLIAGKVALKELVALPTATLSFLFGGGAANYARLTTSDVLSDIQIVYAGSALLIIVVMTYRPIFRLILWSANRIGDGRP